MQKQPFLSRIETGVILVADGATGTNLISRGLPGGLTAENWVLEQPEKIIQLHSDFINAGADIILTATFNANRVHFKGTSLESKLDEINCTAVRLTAQAIGDANIYNAGSMGPLGQLLKPLGPLSVDEAKAAYAQQAKALTTAGADLLVIETQYDLGEVTAAVDGVREVSDLPLIVSLSYDRGKRTMMGVSPAQEGKQLSVLPVDIIGINCGRSLDENLQNLVELRQNTTKPIWFKPNAGLPHLDSQGNTTYDVSPQLMGSMVLAWLKEGASIVGGCCGTTPDHLAQIAAQIKH
ncbi:MAG: methionine synthase I [Anaerolineales bacterium]|nr:homocysteine S-methyltransferase family protein [Anaerolineae bacterium]PWB52366.1 MAG: methionine synthase I [Anaerolineales bacterium]